MDNDPNKSNAEEEFSFVEDQEAPKYEPEAGTNSVRGTSGGGRFKKILILIVIVVAIFVLYKLYGVFSSSNKEATEPATIPMVSQQDASSTPSTEQTPETATSAVPTIETPAEEDKTTTEPAPEETVTEAVDKADEDIKQIESQESPTSETTEHLQLMNSKLGQLEQAITEIGDADENLQQQIGGLTTAISGIQDNISALTQQINGLSDQIKSQQKVTPPPTTTVTKTPVSKPKKRVRRVSVKPPKSVYVARPSTTYFVRAVIQGRAWLITPDGATFTISTGDNLPGYGQILSIDAKQGIVMTSSGRVIGFMPQDR